MCAAVFISTSLSLLRLRRVGVVGSTLVLRRLSPQRQPLGGGGGGGGGLGWGLLLLVVVAAE